MLASLRRFAGLVLLWSIPGVAVGLQSKAWEQEGNPKPLGMPLQGMVTMEAIARTSRYAGAGHTQQVAFNQVGQVVGMMKDVRSCREVILELAQEYVDALFQEKW